MAAERPLQKTRIRAEHAPAVNVDLKLLEVKDLLDRHETFLPAAFGKAMRRCDLLHIDADHRLA
jgi:hypothetical protein